MGSKVIIRPKVLSPQPRIAVSPVSDPSPNTLNNTSKSAAADDCQYFELKLDGKWHNSSNELRVPTSNPASRKPSHGDSACNVHDKVHQENVHEYPPPNYVMTMQDDTPDNEEDSQDQEDEEQREDRRGSEVMRSDSLWSRARKSITSSDFRHLDLDRLRKKDKLSESSRKDGRPSSLRAVADQAKCLHSTFAALNISMAIFGTVQVITCAKDMENSHLKYRNVDAAKKEFFDLGSYPMSGMLMILFGGVLDGLTTMAFLCGYCCQCSYYRHYIRFSFMNLLLTATCAVVLYVTEIKADEHMRRYFKIVMHLEYGTAHHPVGVYNFIDKVQIYGHCCGYKGPEDWTESKWWEMEGHREVLPTSCCPHYGQAKECLQKSEDVYKTGCSETVFDTVGGWRKAAKYVVLLKVPVIFTAIIICSLLYKKTWEYKENRRINDTILTRHGNLGRLFAQGQLQMISLTETGGNGNPPAHYIPEQNLSDSDEERERAMRNKRRDRRLLSHGWNPEADVV